MDHPASLIEKEKESYSPFQILQYNWNFFKTRLKHNVLKNLVWKTKDWIFDHVMQVTVFSVVYRYLQEQTGFQQTQGSVADGVLTCGFDLQKSAIDLDADSYLFFANGEIFPKQFNGKSHTFVYSFSRQWFRIQVNMLPMCYILCERYSVFVCGGCMDHHANN